MPNNDGNDLVPNPPLEESEGLGSYQAQKFAANRFAQSFYPDPYAAEYSDDIPNDGYTPFVLDESFDLYPFTAQALADTSFIYADFFSDNSALSSFDGYKGFLAQDNVGDPFDVQYNQFLMSYDGYNGFMAEYQGDGYFVLDEFLMSYDGYDGLLAESYADADGYFTFSELVMGGFEAEYWGCGSLNGGISTGTIYYKMIGLDIDCPTITYRTWVVLDSPDPFGTLYIGPKCGPNPLADIAIEATWFIPN